MSEKWISAHQAYLLVSNTNCARPAELICARAHDGLIQAKAQTLIWGNKRRDDAEIPSEFWWAKGKGALNQNWTSGDFDTWIERSVHCRAYGVTFRLSEIRALIPEPGNSDSSAELTSPKVDMLPASTALERVENDLGLTADNAAFSIIKFCAAGMVRSHCEKISITTEKAYGATEQEAANVPLEPALWQDLNFALGGVSDWADGRFYGSFYRNRENSKVRLEGVTFSADDIAKLVASEARKSRKSSPAMTKSGRPPAPFWDDLWVEIGRALYVGDLKPKRQADIEKAMQSWLQLQGQEAADSTIRSRARKLWKAITAEDKN